jgi:Kef-type K+ transport system membrane component KefB/nucleotide-binding universal stress UspA family protein
VEALLHAPLPIFIVQALLIVILSRIVGLLSRRLGQPMVIAEIVAGILLGPSLFGWAAPRLSAAVFPARSLPLLGLTSQVGLILFMFLIGLELDPKLLRGRARTSVAISYTSILLPFALGAILALRVRGELAPAGVSSTAFLLFMGAAMSITAFPVLARILVERRLLRSRVGAIAIACAAVDDVTAWCILAFVVSVARASSAMNALGTVFGALVYIAFMVVGVRPLLARFADRSRIGLSQNLVALIVVGLLLSSFVTELIGIHALFGAFLFGAILPKQGTLAAALAEKIEDIVVVFLLPLFFAYSGLRTQIGLLDTPQAWATCALIIAAACLGKFGGSFVAGRLTGLSWREAGAVGVLMNTRGLMELVVLNVGLDLGVISPALFTMMVVMALVTTFVTTPILQVVYPIEQFANELADAAPPSRSVAAADAYTAVICVAHEKTARGLLTLGAAVTGTTGTASRLYALRLVSPADRASFVLDQQRPGAEEPANDAAFEPLLDRARELDVTVRRIAFVSATPGKDICAVAAVKRADVVVLGWHKPLVGGAMLTGVVHAVMEDAPCDVAVLVDRGLQKVNRVLVPYLGTDDDRAALRLAKRIAENSNAEVTVFHVVAPEGHQRIDAHGAMHEELEDGEGDRRFRVVFKAVSSSVPSQAVIDESRHGYDLLLVGVGRQWGLEHKSFGTRAEVILAEAAVSVVVVRHGRAQPDRVVLPEEQPSRFATAPPSA